MGAKEAVERLLLADRELATLDTGVVHAQDGVDVVEALSADVRELLDLRGDVLDLVVRERERELLNTRLDGVPACEAMPDRDVAGEAEVLGLEDLVGRWVVEDGFGVDTGLVGEGTVAASEE